MKRIIIDLDDTLTVGDENNDYLNKKPRSDVIDKIREYKSAGFEIIIMTARNMNTHNNSIGLINAKTLPIVIQWLNDNSVPFDEIHVGKPWCGNEGFYVDDKAIRPDEFAMLSYEQIQNLINKKME